MLLNGFYIFYKCCKPTQVQTILMTFTQVDVPLEYQNYMVDQSVIGVVLSPHS